MEQIANEIIAFKILDYLNEHPNAQDTSEGIIDWWLPQVDIKYQSSRISEVLKDLTAKDVILEQKQIGAPTYKLNPDKKNEISTLIMLLKHSFR